MKKVLLALIIGLSVNVFAQEKDANTFKEEGNKAYQIKDYKGAFTAYAEALKLLEADGTVDDALIYNTGYCAFKAKKYDDAIPYFKKSMETGYKESKPYQMVAVIQFKEDSVDRMIETCQEGLGKYANDQKLLDYASTGYLVKGLKFYDAGNDIKSKANESGWNESDPDKFNAEYAKADEQFKKALPFMEKSLEYNKKNEKTLKALENIYTNLKMDDKAAEIKAQLGSN